MKLFNGLFTLIHVLLLVMFWFWPLSQPLAFWAMLDVGQGDAVLIHTKAGHNILIDAGPDTSILYALDEVMAISDRTIDLIFITHPHADHLGGALYILQHYHVGGVVMSNVAYNSGQYALLKKEIASKGILLFEPQAEWDWRLSNDLYLDILFPFGPLNSATFKNLNNASTVSMLRSSGYQMLLTGDMEEELELLLSIYYGTQLKATDLKVGHHGSKTSSSPLLLNLVQPQEVFISVGRKNSFHHPSETTLERLTFWGSIKRTDEVGTITKILL
jgi:competence protein ComEC